MTDDVERVGELANRVLARARQVARSSPPRTSARRTEAQYSSAVPDQRDPETISDAVVRLVADRGWQTQAAIGRIWAQWSAIVGPTLAEHVTPELFEHSSGRLVLRADSTAWATQVRLLADQLRRRLQEEVPDQVLTDIVVLGPQVGPRPRGRLRVKGPGQRDTYG